MVAGKVSIPMSTSRGAWLVSAGIVFDRAKGEGNNATVRPYYSCLVSSEQGEEKEEKNTYNDVVVLNKVESAKPAPWGDTKIIHFDDSRNDRVDD